MKKTFRLYGEQTIREDWKPKSRSSRKELQEERGPDVRYKACWVEDVGESCVVEYDDECDERDYCVPEDESASAKGDYVSLVDIRAILRDNQADSAHQVWNAIYWKTAFSRASFPASASLGKPLTGLVGQQRMISNQY